MTADNTANAYLRTKVLTARPEQLRLMLLEGAVRFLRQARDGLAAKDFSASFDGFSKGRNIILELMNSMRPDVDPDLCARVQSLYIYIYQLTVEASLEKDIPKADKAIELIDYERETWELAISRLDQERKDQDRRITGLLLDSPAPTTPIPALAPVPAATQERRPLSLQG